MDAYWDPTDHEDKTFVAIRLNGASDFTSACSVTVMDLLSARIKRDDGRAEIILSNGDCVVTSLVVAERLDSRGLVITTRNREYIGK